MRSPAEPARGAIRRGIEGAAHGVALAILLWLLLDSLRGPGSGPTESLGVRALPAALARWTTAVQPARVHLTIDDDLTPGLLDWLAALAGAGTTLSWDPGLATPLAAVAEPVADPAGGTRVRVGAPAGAMVALADRFGLLDSIAAGRSGATFLVRSGPSGIVAGAGALAARSAVSDSLVLGRILVLGQVGWESKFVVAALEERGWRIDARLRLSPKGDVVQGLARPLDTSRYAAVIVLDSAPSGDLAAVPPFVRAGGGAIITAAATRAPALRGLGTALLAATLPPEGPFDSAASAPRRSLGLVPIADAPGQIVLESRNGRAAIAARRIERGRLLLLGYQDTWRWRMAGGGDAAEAHRSWWADLVGAVAYVGRVPRPPATEGVDEAPFAHLVERLGPASPPSGATAVVSRVSRGALFGLLAGLLLLGWASRRHRGAA